MRFSENAIEYVLKWDNSKKYSFYCFFKGNSKFKKVKKALTLINWMREDETDFFFNEKKLIIYLPIYEILGWYGKG